MHRFLFGVMKYLSCLFLLLGLGLISACPTTEITDEEEPPQVDDEPSCGIGLSGSETTYSVSTSVPGHFMLEAEKETDDGKVDRLTLGLRHGGVFGGIQGPGTYDIGGSTFNGCDSCLSFWSQCDAGTDDCEKVFFATEAEIEITQWDATQIAFTVNSAFLEEVNINNPIAVMPRSDGEKRCMENESFAAPTGEENDPIITEPECVEEGNGSFLGNNVANFSLPNCLGEMVSLHDRCGESEALWIMATTGWCVICGVILNGFAESVGGFTNRENMATATPGLDLLVVLGENVQGDEPSFEFCEAYAADHNLDPAMVLIDYKEEGTRIDMIEPIGETHFFRSLATTYENINPYYTEEANGGLTQSYPWDVVLRGTNMEYYWSDHVGESSQSAVQEKLISGE